MQTDFDILIVGGGMVGASLVCALQSASKPASSYSKPLSVALCEASSLSGTDISKNYQPSFDERTTVLSYSSKAIFADMGLWPKLAQYATPIQHIHVSDRNHFGITRLNSHESNIDAFGYVVANQWIGQVLLEQIHDRSSVQLATTLLEHTQVISLVPKEKHTLITIERKGEKRVLTARLVIMAAGGVTNLLTQLGIEVARHDYQQSAVICNVMIDQSHHYVAYERFTKNGPLALLPLTLEGETNQCAVIWTQKAAQAEQLANMKEAEFLAKLQHYFGYRLGKFIKTSQRFLYPLYLNQTIEQVRHGLVVIGNAAHTLHPVAGQGFNLALRDVTNLVNVLNSAWHQDELLQSLAVLNRYQSAQYADQQKVIGATHRLVSLFSNDNLSLSLLRDMGLVALDIMPTAKKLFSQHAMGIAGKPQRLTV